MTAPATPGTDLSRIPLSELLGELIRRAKATPVGYGRQILAGALAEMYEKEDRVYAVLAVARYAEVGVCWLDRGVIEDKLGVTLTDAQWARAAHYLEYFDEWMDDSGADASISHFVEVDLLELAGLTWNEDGTELVDREAGR